MRVAIVGAHGTGKSTLATQLAEALKLPLIEEQARRILEYGYSLDRNITALAETFIFLLQLDKELENESFVTDRCFIDTWVYFEVNKHNWSEGEQAIANLVQKLISTNDDIGYDKLIYVPIEFALVGDGIRDEDLSYQKELDNLFVDYILRHSLAAIKVTGNPKERLKQALNYINL